MRILCVLAMLFLYSQRLLAESESLPTTGLPEQTQALKEAVLQLNRDLFILEEDLLFPPNTQIVVFVSWDKGVFFDLDAVELKIDGKTVTTHLYTEKQKSALKRGGMQKLYLGNLKAGEHEVTALLIGFGPNGRPYKRAASHVVRKTTQALRLELKIEDRQEQQQPEFKILEWES